MTPGTSDYITSSTYESIAFGGTTICSVLLTIVQKARKEGTTQSISTFGLPESARGAVMKQLYNHEDHFSNCAPG
jgi:hypothetical protein